jgi:hypothetical protein
MAISLKDQLEKARIDLKRAEDVQAAKEANTKDTRYGKFEDRPKSEKDALLAELTAASKKVNTAKKYYDKLQSAFTKEQEKKVITGDTGVSEEKQAANLGITVEELKVQKQAALQKYEDEQDQAAKANGVVVNTGSVSLNDFIKNLDASSTETINEIKGYLGVKKLDGRLDVETINAIYAKEKDIETLVDATGRPIDRLTYYKSTIRSGAAGAVPYGTISSATEASAKINDVWQAELGRDATDEEVKKYTPILNEAERKNLTKTVKGITTGGLNKIEFLTQIVKKLPEATAKKSDKLVDAKAKLTATALANGFTIDNDFADDLPVWLDAIDKGQKVDKFQQSIRNAARRLLPEGIRSQIDPDEDLSTTFSTYRSNYAKSRGVPVNTVSLAKIIPMATTDKGFATNREFEVNKRKDPLFDTSDEAIGLAYDAVNAIKSNWGF